MLPQKQHEGVPLVETPLTDGEALSLMDKSDNTLTVCILIGVDELIDCGDTNKFDDFNDGLLPRVLESDHRFTDISYDPVGIRVNKRGVESDGPNEIILKVCGSLQDLVDEKVEEEEGEEDGEEDGGEESSDDQFTDTDPWRGGPEGDIFG